MIRWPWWHPAEQAAEAMVAAIRHVAELRDADQKYHETMTRAWLHLDLRDLPALV